MKENGHFLKVFEFNKKKSEDKIFVGSVFSIVWFTFSDLLFESLFESEILLSETELFENFSKRDLILQILFLETYRYCKK